MDLSRTIVAVSSGIAASRKSVIRISGSQVTQILRELIGPSSASSLDAKRACRFRTNAQLSLCGRKYTVPLACYYWPNARSFTGEACAELHLTGALPLMESMVEQLVTLGADLAERGEFTLRSFLAGKLDLTQAEAVLGVIEADEANDLEHALGQLAGNISQPVKHLKDEVVGLCARLEAGLDFVEEDIEFISTEELTLQLSSILSRLNAISEQLTTRGSRNRIPTAVIVGLPNAGKSTLFNRLCNQDRAIVSQRAGTTRDAIRSNINVFDQRIELVDTAGIEELANATPRALAQTVLKSRLAEADLIVFCIARSESLDPNWYRSQLDSLKAQGPVLTVGTKTDLAVHSHDAPDTIDRPCFDVVTASNDEDSLNTIRDLIHAKLAESNANKRSEAMHQTIIRCRKSLTEACGCIQSAIENAESMIGEEIVAADLRLAIIELSSVIGEVHTEDILGEIFSRFCIGK